MPSVTHGNTCFLATIASIKNTATEICRFRFAEPRQSVVAHQLSFLFQTLRFSLLARTHGNTCFLETIASIKNTVQPQGYTVFLVEATGIEPTTSASRTLRATSCATPRFFISLHRNAFIIADTFLKVNSFLQAFTNNFYPHNILLTNFTIFQNPTPRKASFL